MNDIIEFINGQRNFEFLKTQNDVHEFLKLLMWFLYDVIVGFFLIRLIFKRRKFCGILKTRFARNYGQAFVSFTEIYYAKLID